MCPSESTEVLMVNQIIFITIIVQENNVSKLPTSFEEYFEQIGTNRESKEEKFEPKTKFEKNIDEIKADHMKIITSIDMNISAIVSKKTYYFYKHLNTNIMPRIILK